MTKYKFLDEPDSRYREVDTGDNSKTLVLVAETTAGGYSWHKTKVAYSIKTGNYYLAEAGGCSCVSFSGLVYRLSDFREFTKKSELVKAMREILKNSRGDSPYSLGQIDYMVKTVEEFEPKNIDVEVEEKPEFRVIVAGSRDFTDKEELFKEVDKVLREKIKTHNIVIVSGCARGADSMAIKYAEERGYQVNKHPAQWDTYGKRAGYVRNSEMADSADALIAFTYGSKGTQHMIDLARKKGLPTKVLTYSKEGN